MYEKRKSIEKYILLFLDLMVIGASLAIAYLIRFNSIHAGEYHLGGKAVLFGLMLIYIAMSILWDYDRYFFRRGNFEETLESIKRVIVLSVIWVFFLYVSHFEFGFSRLVIIYFSVSFIILDAISRILLRVFIFKAFSRSRYARRLLIVTESEMAETVLSKTVAYNDWSRNLIGMALVDRHDKVNEGTETVKCCVNEKEYTCDVLAHRLDMIDYVQHNNVDEVFIVVKNATTETKLKEWVNTLRLMGIKVDVNIDTFDLCDGEKNVERVGKYATVTFSRKFFGTRDMISKRALDIIGGLVGCILSLPILMVVAPIIKLNSPGPVLFKQKRVGKNGRIFYCYKLRSMYIDAEERKKELMAQNQMKGLMFKMDNDPRITSVGKFIRKTSIDELPQFWNILMGDMSLVGTRPPTLDEYQQYEPYQKARLMLLPGLTGLWQVSGRSDITDFEEIVKLDLEYIENWSFLGDIKIILKTVWVVLAGRGSK